MSMLRRFEQLALQMEKSTIDLKNEVAYVNLMRAIIEAEDRESAMEDFRTAFCVSRNSPSALEAIAMQLGFSGKDTQWNLLQAISDLKQD